MHTSESNGRTGEWSQVSPVVGEMHCSDVKQAESDGFLNILKNQSISNYQKKKKTTKPHHCLTGEDARQPAHFILKTGK